MRKHQIYNLHAAACAYASAKEKREHEQKSPRNTTVTNRAKTMSARGASLTVIAHATHQVKRVSDQHLVRNATRVMLLR